MTLDEAKNFTGTVYYADCNEWQTELVTFKDGAYCFGPEFYPAYAYNPEQKGYQGYLPHFFPTNKLARLYMYETMIQYAQRSLGALANEPD